MDTYTKKGTSGNDFTDLLTISGLSSLPVNGSTYIFDGLSGTDTLKLSVNNSYPYLGYFLSTNFTIPATPDAYGQYVITGTIMSDIAVTLKLTSVEQLVFADKTVSLAYPGTIDATPPTVVVFNPPGILPTSSSISVTFSEPIQKGTGYVYLRGDGGYRADYNVVSSPNLTISGSTITIHPTTAFNANSEYSVTFATGSIKDLSGNGCIGSTEYHVYTNSGSVTPSYSTLQIGFGKVATDFGGGYDFATNVTIQPDGKILVAGSSTNAGNMDVVLVRYNADGSLDTSFGGGEGKITTDFGYGDLGGCLPQLSEGKVLVIGQSVINWGSYGKGILARYNTDGTLDTSFDGDGKVITMLDGMSGLYFGSGIVQKDGKIVVVGTVYTEHYFDNYFIVLRYNSDGRLDTSFDTDGFAIIPVDGSRAQCVVQQSDDKILVAGTSYNGVDNDIVLVRYNTDGSIDDRVITDFGGNEQLGSSDSGGGVAELSDGKILVVGRSEGNIVLLRYNSDLSLDTSFSGDGKVVGNLGDNVHPGGLAVLSDGKILVSGNQNAEVLLLRFNADGSLDSTFAGQGKVTANIGSDLFAEGGVTSGATLQPDGKILVAGQSNGDIGVVRFNADGTLDTTFGLSVNTSPAFSESRAGTVTTDFGGEDTGRSVIVQSDGNILVAGYSGVAVNGVTSYNVVLSRYTAEGTNFILDPSFNLDGKLTTDFGGNDYGRSVAELSGGKILLAGSTTLAGGIADFVLARYNADGTLDSTFASNGKVITDFSSVDDIANSIKVLSDGKILVAGTGGNNFAVARYNSNGFLDTTFQGGGKCLTDFGGAESGMSVAVQRDGKILVAGTSTLPGGNADFAVARYNTDGTLDTTFHGDGKVTTDFGGADSGQSVVIQSDGKIIVGGTSIAIIMESGAMLNSNFALVRYNTDGTLDATFHGDGRLTTDFGATTASGASVILQSDGKILVAGSSYKTGGKSDFALARYNTDGSLDTSFHGDGRCTMDFGGSSDTCYSISIDGNGKILVAGTSDIDGNGDFALARINMNGTLDATFGGLNTTPIYTDYGTPVVLDSFLQINDTELATIGNFAGATLKLMRHNGAVSEDLFSNTGTLGSLIEGGNLVVGSTIIGTINSNSHGAMELGFNSNATQTLVNAVLQQIAYSSSSHLSAASVQIDWAFADGNTGSQGAGGSLSALNSTTVQIVSDTASPIVTTFSPTDGSTGVAVNSDIVLTFNETIQKGTGTIAIHSGTSNGTVVAIYDVATSKNLTLAGNILTINPTTDLANGTHYFVTFSGGSVKDLAGNGYAGLTTYDFTTSSNGGMITTDFGGDDFGFGAVIQSDGKILVAGIGNADFALARYNQNGSLDSTFDIDGKVNTDFGGSDFLFGLTVQLDGKILVSGSSNGDFALARYNIDGSLDTSFSGDGKVITESGGDDSGTGVTIQSDGKILLSGFSNEDFALVRYNSDGTLDASFSGDGIVITNIGNEDYASGVAVQADGKILVTGNTWLGNGNSNFALVRYNQDGNLDTSFSGDGIVTTDINYRDQGIGITLQNDGKIIVVGESNGDFAVLRYNTNGSLDTSFSGDGIVTKDVGNYDSAWSAVVQSDGKILVVGYVNGGIDQPFSMQSDGILVKNRDSNFALIRYNSDGSLDTSFGNGGVVTTDFGYNDIAFGIALQSDGKIVLSGGSDGDFALARYNTDGSLDASFGESANGIVTTTADNGKGSLRSAIEYINASGGNVSNIIQFAISGTIVIDPDNPLPVIARPVSFVMDGHAVEVKLENAPVLDGIPAVAFLAESNVAVSIPENLTVTVTGSHRSSVLGSYGTLVLNEMAGVLNTYLSDGDGTQVYTSAAVMADDVLVNGDLSGSITVNSNRGIVGLGANHDVLVIGNLSGKIAMTSSQGDAVAVGAIHDLTIGGSVTSSAEIIVTGKNSAVGLGGPNGYLDIAGDMAGHITVTSDSGVVYGVGTWQQGSARLGSYSGTIIGTAKNFAVGLGVGVGYLATVDQQIPVLSPDAGNFTIANDFSGQVTVTSAHGFAFGVFAIQNLTIGGGVNDTAVITATVTEESTDDGVAICAMNDLVINGDMAGTLSTKAIEAGGIGSGNGSLTLGALSGSITVDGVDLANGVRAQSITIHDSLSGDIAVTASRSDAAGLESRFGNLIIGGNLSGTVTVHAQKNAYGLHSAEEMVIGTLSGDISTISENNYSFGLWAKGELHGTTGQPLLISGTVSAVGNIAGAVVAGGAMNLIISGTLSGCTTSVTGSAFSIISIISNTNGYESATVSDQVTVTGTGKLVGNVELGAGDDTMTLQAGADVTGVAFLDGGIGTDRIRFSGYDVVDLHSQSARVWNFEIIDLTDAKHNTLAISSADDVVKVTDADHDLYIVGDSGDSVRFSSSGVTFTSNETRTIDGVAYAHYITSADATVDLYVQNNLVVEFGDVTAPTVTSFSPLDGAAGVAVSSDISLTFSESVQRGSGLVEIHNGSATGNVVESFDAATSQNLTISGNTLTINPAANLVSGMHYFVTMSEGSIKDLTGNTFAGMTEYDFTTEGVPPELYNLNGGVTFWKAGVPIIDVESSTCNSDIGFARTLELRTQFIEFKNIQVATDGTRTIEIWETPENSSNSLQLAFTFSQGSVATWEDAAGLPSGWTSIINTEKPGQFILGGKGTTALPLHSVMLGTLTLTQPTNPDRFDLFLNAGWLGNNTVSGIGIASDNMITCADGIYQHLGMPCGSYDLTSAKVSGTAEDNGTVDLLDAITILKSIVGLTTLNPYEEIAADFNKSDDIDLNDAIGILKHVVGLPAPTPEWVFVDKSDTIPSLEPITVDLTSDTTVDLVGILRGDVNGSWAA